ELYKQVQCHLLDANEDLLGLHRVGPLSYEEYAAVANHVVDAQEALKRLLLGVPSEEEQKDQAISLPVWLFTAQHISPLAKWTYAHLLKLRREFCRPGRNALVIAIHL